MDGVTQLQLTSGLPPTGNGTQNKVNMGAAVIGAGPNPAANVGCQYKPSMFYCRARRSVGLYPYSDSLTPGYSGAGAANWNPLSSPYTMAKSDYGGNGGTIGMLAGNFNGDNSINDMVTGVGMGASIAAVGATLAPSVASVNLIIPYPKPAVPGGTSLQPQVAPAGTTFTGVVWYRSQVSMRMIPDGTSKVYLFGEKYMEVFDYTTGISGNGDEENAYTGMNDDNIRLGAGGGVWTPTVAPNAVAVAAGGTPTNPKTVVYLYPPVQDSPYWPSQFTTRPVGAVIDYFNKIRFGGPHAGAMNMAFCVGSVHSVLYDIDPVIHALLSDRQDAQVFDASAYVGELSPDSRSRQPLSSSRHARLANRGAAGPHGSRLHRSRLHRSGASPKAVVPGRIVGVVACVVPGRRQNGFALQAELADSAVASLPPEAGATAAGVGRCFKRAASRAVGPSTSTLSAWAASRLSTTASAVQPMAASGSSPVQR